MKIFVSSTFKDMHAERDMLHFDVFPEIAEFIRDYGEELTFIDLRWGINTQTLENDESARKILSVCLDEIDNSKPYLIAFLGERYGWIPDKKLIESAIKQKPPEFSYLAEMEKSVTALEIEYGALAQKGLIDHCLFYLRKPLPLEKMNQEHRKLYCSEGEEYKRRLDALKAKIINSGGNIKEYPADWDEEKNCVTGLDELKKLIISDLKDLIKKEFGEKKKLTWQEKETKEAEFLFKSMLNRFSAREKLCNEITGEILSGSSNLIVIKGKFGFGKSTLMAKLAANAKERRAHVLPVICGRSKNTFTCFDVWRQIVYYLEDLLNLPHMEKKEFEHKPSSLSVDWVQVIAKLMDDCSKKLTEPVVIFIDGVDKLSSYRDFQDLFRRLLAMLPKNAVFVVSSSDDFDASLKQTKKIKYSVFMLDDLDADEKKSVLEKLEASQHYQKELPLEVKSRLLSMPQSSNPLYLSMMYHRMVMLDSDDFREIMHLGDGIEGQTKYMLRLIEDAPDDIDGVAAMIMEEAASRVNKELCNEVLRLIAVTRYGLREADFKYIFRKRNEANNAEFNMLDVHRLYKYMRPYFYERSDGRINFAYECFRSGILKNLSQQELKKLNEEVFALLDSFPDLNPVHRDEYVYFAWKCDNKLQFLKRMKSYNDEHSPEKYLLYKASVARGLYDICMKDKGQWLISILKDYLKEDAISLLLDIICIDFCVFFNTPDQIAVLIPIMEQALQSVEYIAKEHGTPYSIHNLRVIPYLMGSACELCKMYDQALAYYYKTLEIYDSWGPDVGGYELIYDEICDVYKLCGKFDQALEYCCKSIEVLERKAKKFGDDYLFLKLISYFEKAAELCNLCGMHDEMAAFQNKASSIKELSNRIYDDMRNNQLFKFEFISQRFPKLMNEAAEHKNNGNNDEALKCCEEAFELLENEIKKWNKTEDLVSLSGFYEMLAAESESVGNKNIAQECLRKSRRIKECITEESTGGEWYYMLLTKWQKVKID